MLTQVRETVIQALLDKLSASIFSSPVRGKASFTTFSRRLKHWSDVPRSERPALFLVVHDEDPVYRAENVPAYVKLSGKVFVYLDTSEVSSTYIPDADINSVLDAIDAALAPSGEARQTLGGLVSHCRVEGTVMRDPGDLDGDGMIVVPITITLT
jgi:hypothetical protein